MHRDRWISVRADRCVTEAGVEISPYYVLEYRDWVHVVAISEHNKVILLRQYRHGLGEVSLELPGGIMDSGETDPLSTGARELLEETGYRAGSSRLIARMSPNPATHTNHLHVVLCHCCEYVQKPSLDPTEQIETCIVDAHEVLSLIMNGTIVHGNHIASLMIAFKTIGFLHM